MASHMRIRMTDPQTLEVEESAKSLVGFDNKTAQAQMKIAASLRKRLHKLEHREVSNG